MKTIIQKLGFVAALLLSFHSAYAYEFEIDGITYEVTSEDSRTVRITDCVRTKKGACDIPRKVTGSHNGYLYSVTSIGLAAFTDCIGLTSVTIPNTVTTIGSSAFSDCTGLTSVTIPNSVITIGSEVWRNCTGLTSITIPNSVTSIGSSAFEGCTGLTSVTIPNSVTSIGEFALHDCTSLTEINVDTENEFFSSIEGVLYDKDIKHLIQYPIKKIGTTFDIPNSVTTIEEGAFYGCTDLTSITIPNSVTTIWSSAFEGCTGLTSITIPDSVTSLGWSAFEGCKALTSITIPDSVTAIGQYTFRGCTSLASVTISNSVASIGERAFYDCTSLTSITIPESVTSIGKYAFVGCSLESVYCQWEEPVRCDDSLFSQSCYNDGILYVPAGCADKYNFMPPWSNFWNIAEKEYSGIEDVFENQPKGVYVVYNLQGIIVLKTTDIANIKQLPAGLYIVNDKKIAIR